MKSVEEAAAIFRCTRLPRQQPSGQHLVLMGETCATKWALANDDEAAQESDYARIARLSKCRGCPMGARRAELLGIEDAHSLERAPGYRADDDIVRHTPVRTVVTEDLDDCASCGTPRKWSPYTEDDPLRDYCASCIHSTQREFGRRRMDPAALLDALESRALEAAS